MMNPFAYRQEAERIERRAVRRLPTTIPSGEETQRHGGYCHERHPGGCILYRMPGSREGDVSTDHPPE